MSSGTLIRLRGSRVRAGRPRAQAPTVTLLTLATKRQLYPHSWRGAGVLGNGRRGRSGAWAAASQPVPGPHGNHAACEYRYHLAR